MVPSLFAECFPALYGPGSLSAELKTFLEMNLPRVKSTKDAKFIVGVVRCPPSPPPASLQSFTRVRFLVLSFIPCVRVCMQIDVKIGSAIQEATNIPCNCNDTVQPLLGACPASAPLSLVCDVFTRASLCPHPPPDSGAHSRRPSALCLPGARFGEWLPLA